MLQLRQPADRLDLHDHRLRHRRLHQRAHRLGVAAAAAGARGRAHDAPRRADRLGPGGPAHRRARSRPLAAVAAGVAAAAAGVAAAAARGARLPAQRDQPAALGHDPARVGRRRARRLRDDPLGHSLVHAPRDSRRRQPVVGRRQRLLRGARRARSRDHRAPRRRHHADALGTRRQPRHLRAPRAGAGRDGDGRKPRAHGSAGAHRLHAPPGSS